MKKILSNVYMLAALFMIGAAITSCSKSDDTPTPEPKPVGPTTYTMTIKATKSADAKTRALSLNGTTLNALWTEGEFVYVYTAQEITDGVYGPGPSLICKLEATNVSNDGTSCTLTGNIDPTNLSQNQKLYLQYRGGNKTGSVAPDQDGTLQTIADYYDRAYAVVTIQDIGALTVTTDEAAFANQQAIVKFTLKDYNGAALPLSPSNPSVPSNPSALTVKYGDNSISLTSIPDATYESNGNGVLYVAIPGFTNQKVTLTATVGNDTHNTYTYVKSGVTFTNGQYYAINVSMVNPYKTPLTLQVCSDNTTIQVWNFERLQYRINRGKWDVATANTDGVFAVPESLKNGDIVSFRGTEVTRNNYYANDLTKITCSNGCYVYVYGNIMSLIDPDSTHFSSLTSLKYDYQGDNVYRNFKQLFMGQDMRHTEGKDLVLPATTLTDECYMEMFKGCNNLDRAPDLPADRVPDKAYADMFGYCSSLKYIKCLATEFGSGSTDQWVVGVPIGSDGTFVRAASMTSWTTGDSGIPTNWTVTTE